MKLFAKEKLVEKDIDWKETYTEKTEFLRKQFTDVVGPGSYFRFEGEAKDTGDRYYCIVGPAKVNDPKAKFFAGVRKLPATYSAGGKYFDSMDRAFEYASNTWGIPKPKTLKPYTSAQLYGISEKIEVWKKNRENNENKESDKNDDTDKIQKKTSVGELHMGSFNLAQFQKIAMGYEWMENREQYRWWDYDQLKSVQNAGQGDPDWDAAVESDSSLEEVLREVDWEMRKKKRELRIKYKITNEVINQQFKAYIGYHASYGAYILFIGPYIGEIPDYKYRYGYFVLRKSPADLKSVSNNIAKYASDYGIKFDLSDFQLNLKTKSGEFDESKEKQNKGTQVIGSLTGSEAQQLFRPVIDPRTNQPVIDASTGEPVRRGPMMGEGSNYSFNQRGLTKWRNYLRKNWGPAFDASIQELAQREHTSEDTIVGKLVTDSNFLNRMFGLLRQQYNEMVSSGEAAALGMSEPPPANLRLMNKAGSQIFQQMPRNELTIRQLMLEKEIAEALSEGIEDPQEILQRLNEFPKRLQVVVDEENRRTGKPTSTRSKAPVDLSEIQARIRDIKEQRQVRDSQGQAVGERPYSEIVGHMTSQIEGLLNKGGFDDLKTAFDTAKLYLTKLPIDPVTGAKMGVKNALSPFEFPDQFHNTTSDDLRRWEEEGEEYERLHQSTEDQRAQQIGEQPEQPEQPELNLETQPESVEQGKKKKKKVQPITPVTTQPEEEDDDEHEPPSALSVFTNTITGLIKIAAELDADGKGEAAEQIHRVIRKYQSRST
ncbi:MAG: hypothetical protein WC375_02155 [Methanomassiliicoccales archaeon]|jgi:hypothetical protein